MLRSTYRMINPHYVILLSIAAIAFFQVVFFQHPMVYDMSDCFLPWRFHIGECLQNGILPFWNPYQDLGYPIHADPSSGAWYPMVWFIGGTIGYTSYTIVLEFFFHIFIAGVGMYQLSKTLRMDPAIALIAGISYMLCGFFVSNAQHLPYIIGAAWLPFFLSSYFQLIWTKKFKFAIYAGFFLFLMITGGYPPFVIILFYFVLLSSSIYLGREMRSNGRQAIWTFLSRHIIMVLVALILSSGMILSVWQVSPYLSRLEGFSLEQVLYSPFGPKAFISFLLPFATVRFPELLGGDVSMLNGYFGLAILLFFFAGLFTKKSFEIKLLFALALFSLTAAVGDALPVREFLFHYIPGMSVFRFPSVFRLFFILPAILIAANYLQNRYSENNYLDFKKWRIPLLIIAFSFVAVILVLRKFGYLSMSQFFSEVVLSHVGDSTINQHVAFQLALQLIFLVAFAALLYFIRTSRLQVQLLTLLVALDLILAVQLNAPHTVHYPQITAKEAFDSSKQLNKGFPTLGDISIAEAGKLPSQGTPYWQNYHIFLKKISAEGFNSFSLGSWEFLEGEYPSIYKGLQSNKVVFLSDSIYRTNQMKEVERNSTFTPKMLFFEDGTYWQLRKEKILNTAGDTAYIRNYTANQFEVQVNVKDNQILTLLQKNYPGWEVHIDGKPAEIYTSNLNFMSVIVPEGKSTITYSYRNPILSFLFFVSLGSLLALLIFVLLSKKTEN
jgi:hypothetical protein